MGEIRYERRGEERRGEERRGEERMRENRVVHWVYIKYFYTFNILSIKYFCPKSL